jgi:hypothetical protein
MLVSFDYLAVGLRGDIPSHSLKIWSRSLTRHLAGSSTAAIIWAQGRHRPIRWETALD